jgi:TPP-dependent pyruvate/acetoin dehydrogenase alpha subunit
MSRKIKVIISVLVAVVVLTVGSAATVMAEGEATPPPEAGAECLLARVAQILGIPQEDLTDAFEQARQEIREEDCFTPCEQVQQRVREEASIRSREQAQQKIRDESGMRSYEQVQEQVGEEALIRVLDRAVGKGYIDEEEAEEIRQWWEQRPEVMERLLLRASSFMPLGGEQVQQQQAHAYGWRASAKHRLQ